MKKCKHCKKEFKPRSSGGYKQVFCTVKCRKESWNLKNISLVDHPNRRCKQCNNWFKPGRKDKQFCSVRCQTKFFHYNIRNKNRIKALQYLGGKCKMCGYKNPCALEFHHRQPCHKEWDVTRIFGRAWRIIKKELDKCDLLCANCHLEVHHDNHQKIYRGVRA